MVKMYSLLMIAFIGSTVSGVPLTDHLETNDIPSESEFLNDINKCALKADTTDITNCATERLVRSLDKLAAQQNLEILPGVSLLSDGSAPSYRSGKELKDEIEKAQASDSSVLEIVGDATARLFSGRTLKVKLPDSESIGRAIEEGRKKMGGGGGGGGNKKKGNDMMKHLMGIGGIFAAMIPIFLGKVALIATKALIVGKIAFVLAGILLFQMFMRRNDNNHNHVSESSWSSSPQVSYGSPSSNYGPPSTSYGVPSGPYSRSLRVDNEDAQNMAYAAQK